MSVKTDIIVPGVEVSEEEKKSLAFWQFSAILVLLFEDAIVPLLGDPPLNPTNSLTREVVFQWRGLSRGTLYLLLLK